MSYRDTSHPHGATDGELLAAAPHAGHDVCVIDADGLSRIGSALSDHTRRRLLIALARGPAYPAELAVELDESRQNVSNHLACLRGCGLVAATPEGRRMRYELVDPRLGTALRELAALTLAVDLDHAHHPEHHS